MESINRVQNSLFLLRLGVFIVMFMWTIDKFINPAHTVSVFERYYLITGLSETIAVVIGVFQLIVITAFVGAYKRNFSYLIVLIMHSVSTVSSYERYLDPWVVPNLLFFAAWPMLAAIVVLYYLRDLDTKFSFEKNDL